MKFIPPKYRDVKPSNNNFTPLSSSIDKRELAEAIGNSPEKLAIDKVKNNFINKEFLTAGELISEKYGDINKQKYTLHSNNTDNSQKLKPSEIFILETNTLPENELLIKKPKYFLQYDPSNRILVAENNKKEYDGKSPTFYVTTILKKYTNNYAKVTTTIFPFFHEDFYLHTDYNKLNFIKSRTDYYGSVEYQNLKIKKIEKRNIKTASKSEYKKIEQQIKPNDKNERRELNNKILHNILDNTNIDKEEIKVSNSKFYNIEITLNDDENLEQKENFLKNEIANNYEIETTDRKNTYLIKISDDFDKIKYYEANNIIEKNNFCHLNKDNFDEIKSLCDRKHTTPTINKEQENKLKAVSNAIKTCKEIADNSIFNTLISLTFSKLTQLNRKEAENLMNKYYQKLKDNFISKDSFFRVTEKQDNENWHFHILLDSNDKNVNIDKMEQLWMDVLDEHNLIYDPKYCFHKITKDINQSDKQFSTSLMTYLIYGKKNKNRNNFECIDITETKFFNNYEKGFKLYSYSNPNYDTRNKSFEQREKELFTLKRTYTDSSFIKSDNLDNALLETIVAIEKHYFLSQKIKHLSPDFNYFSKPILLKPNSIKYNFYFINNFQPTLRYVEISYKIYFAQTQQHLNEILQKGKKPPD